MAKHISLYSPRAVFGYPIVHTRIVFARRPVDEVVGVLLLMMLFLFFYVKIERWVRVIGNSYEAVLWFLAGHFLSLVFKF